MVGLGRFELPTHGLGNLGTLLRGYENFGLYYIPQPDTTGASLGSIPDLTRFEPKPTTVLLQ
jgi:hypothetical protein